MIYCDMDGVLVYQTGRDHFDTMGWMSDGRQLWDFIAPLQPTILSMLPDSTFERCAPQKLVWVRRELGPDVKAVIVRDTDGKAGYSQPGSILIDDNISRHGEPWVRRGGLFIHHRSAVSTISMLRTAGQGKAGWAIET